LIQDRAAAYDLTEETVQAIAARTRGLIPNARNVASFAREAENRVRSTEASHVAHSTDMDITTRGFLVSAAVVGALGLVLKILYDGETYVDDEEAPSQEERKERYDALKEEFQVNLGNKSAMGTAIIKVALYYNSTSEMEKRVFFSPAVPPAVQQIFREIEDLRPTITHLSANLTYLFPITPRPQTVVVETPPLVVETPPLVVPVHPSMEDPTPTPTPPPDPEQPSPEGTRKKINYQALAWSALWGSWIVPRFSLPWLLATAIGVVAVSTHVRKIVRDRV